MYRDEGKIVGGIKEILEGVWVTADVGAKADPHDVMACDLVLNASLVWVPGPGTGLGGRVEPLSLLQQINLSKVAPGVVFLVGVDKYLWDGSHLGKVPSSPDDYSAGERQAYGELQAILRRDNVPPGVKAEPDDITGTSLEMGADGLWAGASVGTLTQVQADALVSSGAMGKVQIGTPAEIDGKHARWTGTAWQSDLIVGPFTDIPAANAWAAANPSSLFPGLLATAGGVQIRWKGAVGWVAAYGDAVGTIYNGTTVPFPTPSASLLGMRIPAVNPAVPRGFSWLECNGTSWAPPAGELIAGVFSDYYTSPIANVVPNALTATEIWSGEIIPDYMLPDRIVIRGSLQTIIINSAGVAGANIGLYVSSSPGTCNGFNGIVSAYNLTPTSVGVGNIWQAQGINWKRGSLIGGPDGRGTVAGSLSDTYPAVAGSTRLRLSIKPSSLTDRGALYGAAIYSAGNL